MNLAVFDIDGTLTLTSGLYDGLYVRTFSAHFGGVPIDTDWSAYPHASDSAIADALFRKHRGRAPTAAEADALAGVYLAALRDVAREVEEVPGARAALVHVAAHPEWTVAVGTGNWGASARLKLERAGIDPDAFALASADDAHSREEILGHAIARAGGPFARVVYVGDAAWDVAATRNLGMPFVGVGDTEHLRALGASHALPDLRDRERLMEALHAARPPLTVS